MRRMWAVIGLGLALADGRASAQIVVNQQALQQLSGKTVVSKPVLRKPVLRKPGVRLPYRRTVRRPVMVHRALPLPPPPEPMPVVAAVKPPPKPPGPRALTMVFPGTTATMPYAQSKALDGFIGSRIDASAHFVVQATAPGVASDPTVARRMSFDRGMAVRAALRRAGVASDHIIVQALGNPPGLVPDHVTLTEIP